MSPAPNACPLASKALRICAATEIPAVPPYRLHISPDIQCTDTIKLTNPNDKDLVVTGSGSGRGISTNGMRETEVVHDGGLSDSAVGGHSLLCY
jgi:hypothetical protein